MSKWAKRLDLSKKIFLITGAASALAVAVIFQSELSLAKTIFLGKIIL